MVGIGLIVMGLLRRLTSRSSGGDTR